MHTAGKGALTRPPRLSTALTRHSPPSGMCAGWQELRPRAPGHRAGEKQMGDTCEEYNIFQELFVVRTVRAVQELCKA